MFAQQVIPSEDDINRARRRKLIGNPPGKPNDPLGDQLTWEQFITQASTKTFWIITRDSDYCDELLDSKIPTLNPLLMNELKAKCGVDVEVFCFRTLADGLDHFANHTKLLESKLPNYEELKTIAEEERQLPTNLSFSSAPSYPTECPQCKAMNSFTSGAYLNSRHGGLTLQYICQRCGFRFDTGDFFD